MERKLPEKLYVNGIPYSISEPTDSRYICASTAHEQLIQVRKDIPFPKQLQYLAHEIAYRLLEGAGVKEKTNERYYPQFGNVLYRFIRENKLDWLYKRKGEEIPTMVFINGLPYSISMEHGEYLDGKGFGGEIRYEQLLICLSEKMETEITAVTCLHEIAHAILHEGQCGNLARKEEIVEPLSYLLYQLFTQNDFSFASYDV